MVWDNYYGAMHPGFVLGNLRGLVDAVDDAASDTPIPPELEREVTALRKLHRRVKALDEAHSEGRKWKA